MKSQIKEITEEIRLVNKANGWNVWQQTDFKEEIYKFPAIIALIHSESSEALEWYRQINKTGYVINGKIMSIANIQKEMGNAMDELKLTYVSSEDDVVELIKEEMADIIIRCLDWWSAYDDDPMDTIRAKIEKNRSRGHRHGDKKI